MLPSLALSGAILLASSAAFVAVGRLVRRRSARSADAFAGLAAAVWWRGLAAYNAIHGVEFLLGAFGFTPFALFLTLRFLGIPVLVLALWGLTFHVVYLFTGRQALWRPIAAAYAVYAVGVVALLWSSGPYGVEVGPWRTDILYREPIDGGPLAAVIALLLLPPLVAAVGYVVVAARADDGAVRLRALALSAVLVVWFGSAGVARMLDDGLAQLLTRPVLGLLCAAALLALYRPAGAGRAWLDEMSKAMSIEATAARARDLI